MQSVLVTVMSCFLVSSHFCCRRERGVKKGPQIAVTLNVWPLRANLLSPFCHSELFNQVQEKILNKMKADFYVVDWGDEYVRMCLGQWVVPKRYINFQPMSQVGILL